MFSFLFSFRPSLRTDLMVHQSNRRAIEQNRDHSSQPLDVYDASTHYFHKFGSSFNQVGASNCQVNADLTSQVPANLGLFSWLVV